MAIVLSADIIAYLGVSTYSADIQAIHEGIEAWLKKKTGQPWESTTYTNKLYDGNGSCRLILDEAPIISVKYVGLSFEPAIKLRNTLTDATLQNAVVDDTNLTLTVEGGTGAATSTLAKATYTTLTTMIAQINTLSANGWTAEIYNSSLGSLKTAYLPDQQIDVTNELGVVGAWNYLNIVYNLARNITLDKRLGIIYCDEGFPPGYQNIAITYTVGYTIIPPDIRYFILDSVKAGYNTKTTNAENVSRWTVGDVEMWYSTGEMQAAGVTIPQAILEGNARIRI